MQNPIDAATSDAQPTTYFPPSELEVIRHVVVGGFAGIQDAIKDLEAQGYAEPQDWSKILPTGRRREFMAVLTKRVQPE